MNGTDAQKRQTRPVEAAKILHRRADRVEQRIALFKAFDAGETKARSADIAGVSRNTGMAWLKQRKEDEDSDNTRRAAILSKTELAQRYSEAIDSAPAQYLAQLGGAYARLCGMDAPQRSEVTVRSVPQSVIAWLDSAATALDAVPERHSLPVNTADNTCDAAQTAQLLDNTTTFNDSTGLHIGSYRTLSPPDQATDPPGSPKAAANDIDQVAAQHSKISDKPDGDDDC